MTISIEQDHATARTEGMTWTIKALLGLCLFVTLFFLITAALFLVQSDAQIAVSVANQLSLADLAQRHQPLMLMGSLMADSQNHHLTELRFVLTPALATEPLDLQASPFTIRYRDATQELNNLPWSWRFQSRDNDNRLFEEGELVQIIIPVTGALAEQLTANTTFALELRSSTKTLFALQRTLPATLEAHMALE